MTQRNADGRPSHLSPSASSADEPSYHFRGGISVSSNPPMVALRAKRRTDRARSTSARPVSALLLHFIRRAMGRPRMAPRAVSSDDPSSAASLPPDHRRGGQAAGETADSIRATRGGMLRRLSDWIGWHEGLVTLPSLRSIAPAPSEGHISNLIKPCEWRVW